jgi:ribonuclease G
VGKKDLEETIFKTNLEAAKEVAYQIRLRNIGGIIIIDFIDMEKEKNREKVFAALSEGVARDKAKSRLIKISELGLVQMSRERTREDIARSFCEPCLYCEGRGHTKSPETLCYEIFREIRRIGPTSRNKKVMIGVHPSVANLLCDEKQERMEALERTYHKKMIVKADANLHIEQYEIVPL